MLIDFETFNRSHAPKVVEHCVVCFCCCCRILSVVVVASVSVLSGLFRSVFAYLFILFIHSFILLYGDVVAVGHCCC